MGVIRYHMKEPVVRVLGPGVRYVLWVQGCRKACPGCVAAQSHDAEAGSEIATEALAWEIALSDAEGLTISGGEPFLQAKELAKLVRAVRRHRPMDVIAYSGYTYEELAGNEGARELLDQLDLLIDGPYMQELDDGRGIRGSTNQRIIALTDRFRGMEDELATQPRSQERYEHGIDVHEVGLPSREDAHRPASTRS